MNQQNLLCKKCQSLLRYKPQHFEIEGVKVFTLYEYNDGFSRLLIQYKEQRDIGLSDIFLDGYLNKIKWKYRKYQKIMMPSSESKLKMRGFNHLELMFRKVDDELLSVFNKVDNTKQAQLSKAERSNIHFELNDEIMKVKNRVVLLDDVITTGSTIKEAIRLLEPYNLEICVFCIAITPRENLLHKKHTML